MQMQASPRPNCRIVHVLGPPVERIEEANTYHVGSRNIAIVPFQINERGLVRQREGAATEVAKGRRKMRRVSLHPIPNAHCAFRRICLVRGLRDHRGIAEQEVKSPGDAIRGRPSPGHLQRNLHQGDMLLAS